MGNYQQHNLLFVLFLFYSVCVWNHYSTRDHNGMEVVCLLPSPSPRPRPRTNATSSSPNINRNSRAFFTGRTRKAYVGLGWVGKEKEYAKLVEMNFYDHHDDDEKMENLILRR